jgi:WhiB family redox-sensing transcriptional regulator
MVRRGIAVNLSDIIDTLEPEALTRPEWTLTAAPMPLPTPRRAKRPVAPPVRPSADWRLLAACRGLDTKLFFPERGEDQSAARAVCGGCPVRAECLADGIHEKNGVWGGTSERERRALRRTRRAQGRAS